MTNEGDDIIFMKTITVSAPGKLHLLGEHSVVYGQPALLAAVNKRCFVTIGKSNVLESSLQQYVDLCLKESVAFFQKDFITFSLSLTSDIPLGSGMGSSAAIAVAIAGAISQLLFGKIDKAKVNEIAFRCEKHVHGNPSGGDNTTCTYGGFIWYQKDKKEKIIKPLQLSLSQKITNKFCIINTGKPDESTKEMVERVRIKSQELRIKNIFEEQGKLTEQLLGALEQENEDKIVQIIKQGQYNLEQMGVVSQSTQQLIRTIEHIGSAAKICGGGGFRSASGIVLAFTDDFAKIQRVAKEFGFMCESITLGEEGVRLEQ